MGRVSMRPVVVLVTICVVAGVLLGFVHQMTAPVIARSEEERAQQMYAKLVPEAATFEELPCDAEGCVVALCALDAKGERLGTIIVAQQKGYAGQVPLAVAFDAEGNVKNVAVMPNEETPGLGSRIADESYIGQYVNVPAERIAEEDADLISGATISSKAALEAFNRAIEAYGEVG